MELKTIIALSIGTAVTFILVAILMNCYKIKVWKSIPVSILLTVVGTAGTYIWSFVESSEFGARSYYGAVFFVPIVFHYVAKLLNIPYGKLMDVCSPAGFVMLVIMKYQCLVDGCCRGKILGVSENGSEILFPSQIVEIINALILLLIVTWMGVSGKQRGKIYAWFLLLYGSTRFILNFFRGELEPLLLGLPAGNLWSLIAIVIGFMWMKDYRIKIVKKEKDEISDLISEEKEFLIQM